jgi:hypothetical protein
VRAIAAFVIAIGLDRILHTHRLLSDLSLPTLGADFHTCSSTKFTGMTTGSYQIEFPGRNFADVRHIANAEQNDHANVLRIVTYSP